jgi:hypothetical protein
MGTRLGIPLLDEMDTGKSYHKEATGLALETVHKHKDVNEDITLFGSCFCPFVQRVWVTFQFLGVPYKVSLVGFKIGEAKRYEFM